jgi:hypothetical protein
VDGRGRPASQHRNTASHRIGLDNADRRHRLKGVDFAPDDGHWVGVGLRAVAFMVAKFKEADQKGPHWGFPIANHFAIIFWLYNRAYPSSFQKMDR